MTEVSVPWRLFTNAGHQVVFATEKRDQAAGDARLLTGVFFGQLGAEPEAKHFYEELLRDSAFQQPIRWDEIDPARFDALLLPGGHAPGMRQYLGSELLQSKAAAFMASGKPVAAICHGVLILARARDATGKSVLHSRRTTCLTKYQERLAYYLTAWKLGRYYRTYPAYTEDEVRSALDDPSRQFVRGPIVLTSKGTMTDDRGAFVVEDGNYLSARWPGDAYLLAKKVLRKL